MGVRDSASAIYRVEPESAHAREDAVPRGYKRTEVGVIPEEWELNTLLSLADGNKERFDDGDWIEAEYLTESGIRLIQTGNIGIGSFVDKEPRKYISQDSFGKLRCKDVYEGDLLVCRLAEPAGRACIVPKLDADRAITAVDVTIFRPIPERGNKEFLLHYFCTDIWFSEVNDRCGGSTRSRIARGALGQIKVPLPSIEAEQASIAEALGDADALIESLQQLIAKQRAIKQGAMQALLSGRQRLPGFTGEWQTEHLGDIAHIKTGSRNNQDKIDGGQYPFFVRSEEIERINSFSYDCEAILVPGEGRIGDIFHYFRGRFDLHQRVYAITQFAPEVSGRYVHLYMKVHFGRHALENSVKATVDSLRLPTFQEFEIRLPPTREEQTAIATVLSDMDAEIEALEARLAKTRALKAGMMQALLTGRIRLVEPRVTHEAKKVGSQISRGHSKAFNEAVVIATLAKQFGSKRFPLGRKRYTKLAYLLHRHATESMDDYLKKAAGPYNPKTRYGGAERLALEHGYVREHRHDQYVGFVAGNDAANAEEYFVKWYGSGALQWLEQFRRRTNDELELLATVDMAVGELRNAGKAVNMESVKRLIRNHSEWKAKLARSIFSDANVSAAIDESRVLFATQG